MRNGAFARSELSWIAWAISSLPVPDSPLINTVVFVRATLTTCSQTCRIAPLVPRICEKS